MTTSVRTRYKRKIGITKYITLVRGSLISEVYILESNKDNHQPIYPLSYSMMNVRETGLYDKSVETGLFLAYQFFADKEFDFRLEERVNVMVLDQMKIAVGPYMCGTAMAVISSALEIIFYL